VPLLDELMSLLVVPELYVLELVPDDVVELGGVLLMLLDELGDALVEPLVALGDVALPDVDDGLVLVSDDVVELGAVLDAPVPLVLVVAPLVDPVPDVLPAPVAPVPDVPAIEPELLELVSEEPDMLDPCDVLAPVELESALPVPVPVLCA